MAELWQQAAEWLRELGVVPRGHAVFKRTARVYDLALALQDGTLLCQLANRIMPNVIDTIHEDPGKQFLKMQNIQGFLEAASKFGVKESELFQADELYYASDFPKVLSCLSVLSGTKACRVAQIEKFPKGAASNSARDTDGEDM
jgi:guanine nucleotide exchange factor VAV